MFEYASLVLSHDLKSLTIEYEQLPECFLKEATKSRINELVKEIEVLETHEE